MPTTKWNSAVITQNTLDYCAINSYYNCGSFGQTKVKVIFISGHLRHQLKLF